MIRNITKDDKEKLKNMDIEGLFYTEIMLSEWFHTLGDTIARQICNEDLRTEKRLSAGYVIKKPYCVRIIAKEVPYRFNQFTRYNLNQQCFYIIRERWQMILKHAVTDIKEQGGFIVPKSPVIIYRFRFKRMNHPATPNSLFILQALQDWGILDDQAIEAISIVQSIYDPYHFGTEIIVLESEELLKHPELLVKNFRWKQLPYETEVGVATD